MDFTADGRYLIASCEFSGELVKVDVAGRKVVATLKLRVDGPRRGTHKGERVHHGGARMPVENDRMPQDVKTSPDGKVHLCRGHDGGWRPRHRCGEVCRYCLYPYRRRGSRAIPSRDAKVLYCSNRDEGSISVIDFATRRVIAKWRLPPPASPDMGGVSSDGKVLWLSGRYHARYMRSIRPMVLSWPEYRLEKGRMDFAYIRSPGRYSLGHTGVFR